MIQVEVIENNDKVMDKINMKVKQKQEGGLIQRDVNMNSFIRKRIQIKNKHILIND